MRNQGGEARACSSASAPVTPRVVLAAVLVSAVGIALGCAVGKGKQAAEQAVDQFHRQLDGEQYDQIYADAGNEFRKSSSAEDSRAYFSAVHRKLGTVRTSHETGFAVNTTPMGTTARVQYETEYAEGSASESFVYVLHGDRAVLIGYDISSPTLVTK